MHVALDGRTFKVHSCVMRSGSDYFRGMLANAVRRAGKFHFALSHENSTSLDCRSFRVVLDFIYTGQAIMSAAELKAVGQWTLEWTDLSILVDVLLVADYLVLEPMLEAYTEQFKRRLTPATVLEGLRLVGDVFGLHAATKAAIQYYVANVADVPVRAAAGVFSITEDVVV
jgi:hypothetical protein